uniref:Prostaglandin reductase 3 n=1 Tax=Electrophorus electricus TaxID=8005 RepID=A0AAY5EU43_ELEEL
GSPFSNWACAEYVVAPTKKVFHVLVAKPELLALMVSGATAHIALRYLGELTCGETVLVSAAGGGTSQFAKMAGCHAGFLRTIGCDRPINYKTEDMATILHKEYPNGVDVIYKSVGGSMFDLAVNSLATIGDQLHLWLPECHWPAVCERGHSTSKTSLQSMLQLLALGKLVYEVDVGEQDSGGCFMGLESIYQAVDYMYAGRNLGKVVVELAPLTNSNL